MKEQEIRQRKDAASQTTFYIRRILVPTDFTPGSDYAFTCALDLARKYDAQIHLMHVMGPVEGDAYSLLKYSPEAAAGKKSPDELILSLLKDSVDRHDTNGVFVNTVKQRGRSVVPTLLRYAETQRMDLMVVGAEEHEGLGRLFSGEIADVLIRDATCPVLVVKRPGSGSD